MPGQKRSEEQRQEDILRASYDVAARRGLSALSLRAVAERAKVSHGTVLFHFRRREQLITTLLDRVLYATTTLRIPYEIDRLTRPVDKMSALLRYEMERLANEARHFRLFLEYWTLGVRSAPIRSKLKTALSGYRTAWFDLSQRVLFSAATPPSEKGRATGADGLAAVAVSLVHGCALQAVLDSTRFDIQRHFDAAAQMLHAVVSIPAARTEALAGAVQT
ncbi:MAG: TetR/AcrR family transcriptional regulator [Gemmatimonadota bacterium]